jgi:transposase
VKALDPSDLVFLDESGFSLALSVLYGWGKKGEPLFERVPARRGKNLSVLGAFDIEGMVATTSKLGAMTRADVERFLRRDLLPRLLPGCVLVLDNASIHKGGKIEQLVRKAGCRVLYLPPYSPDLNPIELAWAFVKHAVRKCGPREDTARQQAIQTVLAAIPEAFAPACFRHCQYL